LSLAERALALRFISGKYQGGEFPLRSGKEIVIGRSSELDMVLVEDMVSRRHAKLAMNGARVLIEDLGSTNGTFVNGEKVQQSELKVGDRILIGTSILKLVQQEEGSRQLDLEAVREEMSRAALTSRSAGAMSGRIDEVPIPDLLQLFQTSKKNGILILDTGDHEGRVYLRAGKVYYAVIDGAHDLGPQKSFYRIITWEHGSFELTPPDGREFMIELEESTEALLMDGLRQLDELRRLGADLPPRNARLSLAQPLVPMLRDLSREDLDLLQLVHNHGTVAAVMDLAEASDLDAATALVSLLKREYVRRG
jgi:pSer/pThr/pTyr-binding forkhead associated (FHA) protein